MSPDLPNDALQVRLSDVSKRYAAVQALDRVSLGVRRGEIFAYLGPNGAGKTTTISILCGLVPRDAGEVVVCGADVSVDPVFVKSRIGVVTDTSNLYPELNCRRNLEYLGELYGLARAERRARADELLGLFGLTDRAGSRFGSLSRGLQRRLAIAAALVHRPEVLFLDEPTVALDVPSARALRGLIRQVHEQGVTVLLTTHNLAEAESLADRVAILVRGRIVAEGTVAQVRARFGTPDSILVSFSEEIAEAVLRGACPSVRSLERVEGGWRLKCAALRPALAELLAVADERNLTILQLSAGGASLEEAFLSILEDHQPPEAAS
jgi:ABC-2 type transport system ATP-binding protein